MKAFETTGRIEKSGLLRLDTPIDIQSKQKVKVILMWEELNGKNFDTNKISSLIKQINERKIYSEIKDPSVWQKDLRNEWE